MYLEMADKYFEWTGMESTKYRMGHEISKGANPIMKTYPISNEMGIAEFPVFV